MSRALSVLEHLRDQPEARSLSALSRELRVSPSSLLAILRTLGAHGYVERDAAGRYRAGAALAALAETGATAAAIREAVTGITRLADALAAGSAGATGQDRGAGLHALGLAARHLAEVLLAEGHGAPRRLPPAQPVAESGPVWRSEASGPLVGEELDAFLAGSWLATLAYVNADGYPSSVPIWYHWAGGRFWVAPRSGAAWAQHVRHNSHVSLTIGEPEAPLRRVLVEGRAMPAEGPRAAERAAQVLACMAQRYLGDAAPAYLGAMGGASRALFGIVPDRIVTWRGLAPHPRYAAGDGPDDGTLPEPGATADGVA